VKNLTLFGLAAILLLGLWFLVIALERERAAKPVEEVCAELAGIPHKLGALSEFLGPKYVHEYTHAAVLDCLWVHLYPTLPSVPPDF
jgi:hypothetical protein